jgi:CTP:molybdopterin cytidylyltransferase MocA
MSVSGLILAAGAGTRFADGDEGVVKQLNDFRDQPLLQWAIDAHCAVEELDRVLVVLGANAELIARTIRLGRAQAAVCVDWDAGLSASLRLGMHALAEFDRVIVTLADQPLIDANLIRRFVHEPAGTRAAYNGRPGHPVVLGNEHRAAIDQLSGDQGARALLAHARLIECGQAATADMDTITELQSWSDQSS